MPRRKKEVDPNIVSEPVKKRSYNKKPKNTDSINDNTTESKKRSKNISNAYDINSTEITTNNSDEEPIIMQLNVDYSSTNDPENANGTKDVNPNPYENDNQYHCDFEKNKSEQEDKINVFNVDYMTNNNELIEDEPQELKVVKLLKEFEEKNKHNEWPISTSISCYNCCHKFFSVPMGIPVKYVDGVFYVFGCFCSLECAMAHNLSKKDQVDEIWERNNLINLLYKKLGNEGFVKPAPDRLSLKTFGGHLSIDEYRNYTNTNKIVNINFPPMQTITQQIEEINESDINNNDNKYVPIDTDRVNKYKEKIRLKRSKPLHDVRNTLDHAINIRITSGAKK